MSSYGFIMLAWVVWLLGRMCLHDFYRWGNRHASGTHGESQRADRFDCDMCESFGVHNVEVEDIS